MIVDKIRGDKIEQICIALCQNIPAVVEIEGKILLCDAELSRSHTPSTLKWVHAVTEKGELWGK